MVKILQKVDKTIKEINEYIKNDHHNPSIFREAIMETQNNGDTIKISVLGYPGKNRTIFFYINRISNTKYIIIKIPEFEGISPLVKHELRSNTEVFKALDLFEKTIINTIRYD